MFILTNRLHVIALVGVFVQVEVVAWTVSRYACSHVLNAQRRLRVCQVDFFLLGVDRLKRDRRLSIRAKCDSKFFYSSC